MVSWYQMTRCSCPHFYPRFLDGSGGVAVALDTCEPEAEITETRDLPTVAICKRPEAAADHVLPGNGTLWASWRKPPALAGMASVLADTLRCRSRTNLDE